MKMFRSIRFRLALWFFLAFAVMLAFTIAGSRLALRSSMYRGVDFDLGYRITGVREFLESRGPESPEALASDLRERASLGLGGDLFQVFDGSGRLIYRSENLARRNSPVGFPPDSGADAIYPKVGYRDGGDPGFPLRLAYQRIDTRGRAMVIEVAEPVRNVLLALGELTTLTWFAVPFLMLAACGAGFWMSGRALAPIGRIAERARAITAQDLSARLPLPAAEDELHRLTTTLNDMLGRLELSFARIRQFTADGSHELRAPLTLIHTAAELSLRRERSRDDLVAAMTKVLAETKRTMKLVDDLLLLARTDCEPASAHRSVIVDLCGLLKETAETAATLAAPKSIEVSLQSVPGPLEVTGNDLALRRVLLILTDNAVKYTPGGGKISLGLRANGHAGNGHAEIEVNDTGIGISAEDLPKVFDRFWRADKARTRELGGTGLGLAIAQSVIAQHGGTITAVSRPGVGSTFTVRLPLAGR
jgi:heavy metal sensor kinase